jgi:hypothetical protein
MYADGILHESWDQDEHDLSDIVLFALHYTKQRRKCPSHGVSSFRDVYRLRDQVLGYVARVVDRHLADAMGPQSEQDDRAHSWVSPKKVTKPHSDDGTDVATLTRKYVVVQPEAVWRHGGKGAAWSKLSAFDQKTSTWVAQRAIAPRGVAG